MPYNTTFTPKVAAQPAQAEAKNFTPTKPFCKICKKEPDTKAANGKTIPGKIIPSTEITFWKNTTKAGDKEYLSGKDEQGNKWWGGFGPFTKK